MKQQTQQFEAVPQDTVAQSAFTQYPPIETLDATAPSQRATRAGVVLTVVAVVFLVAAAVILFGLMFGPTQEAAGQPATTTNLVTDKPPADQPAEEAQPAVAEPAPAPAPSPAPSDSGHEGPSSDPMPPEATDPPEPETFIHPLEGTLWEVMVLSDGAGGLLDVHPSYPHQIEFEDGRVYTRGSVNGGSAEYAITGDEYGWGNSFWCGPIMTTMMMGPADAMTQEARINTALECAAYYEIFENTLFIRDGSGNDLLILDIVPGC